MPETSAKNSNQAYFSSQEYCIHQESFKYGQLLYAHEIITFMFQSSNLLLIYSFAESFKIIFNFLNTVKPDTTYFFFSFPPQ